MNEIRSTQYENNILPTIIGVAESTHYLVGSYNKSNHFIGLPPSISVASFNSLLEAKNYLRSKKITYAAIEFQSAYDEMCGTETVDSYRELVSL
jgi:hypothetical protein